MTYDAHAPAYAAHLDPTLAGAAARLAELAGARPGMRLLDVATGTGIVARAAAGRGAATVGVDCSQGMLAIARRLAPELDLRHADAGALPFDDGSFEAVTCGLSLSHFEDRDRSLREIHRVLLAGGRFAASAWGAGTRLPDARVGDLLDGYGVPDPGETLDEDSWSDPEQGSTILRRCGFGAISVTTEAFEGSFADAEQALAWWLAWPLTAARLEYLDARARRRLRREAAAALAGEDLSWRMAFNFYVAERLS